MAQDLLLIEEALRGCFEARKPHADLYDAMKYSLLAGGKRLRPVLTLESCRLCGGDVRAALPFACAIEMIHTYSLIHDDLPCMDDDDLRRGRPTPHKVFGEATAVLAGDGLLTAAFEIALEGRAGLAPERVLEALDLLSHAAGAGGMVGGQSLDMAGEGHSLTVADVEELQRLKTGALISAAAGMGCIVAGADGGTRAGVDRYAQKLGLAFQVRDDMLDVAGTEGELGKTTGSDRRDEKTTFVTLRGLDGCADLVEKLTAEAVDALEGIPGGGFLQDLARSLTERRK